VLRWVLVYRLKVAAEIRCRFEAQIVVNGTRISLLDATVFFASRGTVNITPGQLHVCSL
jgi:hypothetical protein